MSAARIIWTIYCDIVVDDCRLALEVRFQNLAFARHVVDTLCRVVSEVLMLTRGLAREVMLHVYCTQCASNLITKTRSRTNYLELGLRSETSPPHILH